MHDATEDAIRAGEFAAAMLEEPVLKEALETLEADYIAVWRNSPLADMAQREEAFRMLKTLDAFKAELTAKVVNGQIARQIAEDRERARLVEGMTF